VDRETLVKAGGYGKRRKRKIGSGDTPERRKGNGRDGRKEPDGRKKKNHKERSGGEE